MPFLVQRAQLERIHSLGMDSLYVSVQKGCEPQMSYSSYDHDDLEPASTMRIERRIYFESGKADLSEMVKLPLAELLSLRAESAAAEQEVFDRLKEQAAAWEEQAGRTLFLDKAL